jgi:hypothetical protein
MLVSAATPALAAGGIDGAPLWFSMLIICLFGVLVAGVGFFLAGFMGLMSMVATILCIAVTLIGCVYLTRDLDPAIGAAYLEAILLLAFSPALIGGWWLGRKDAMRRLNRKNTLSAGSNHG